MQAHRSLSISAFLKLLKWKKNPVQLGKGGMGTLGGAATHPNPPAFLGGLRPPNPPEGHPYLQIAPEARHPYGALDRLI